MMRLYVVSLLLMAMPASAEAFWPFTSPDPVKVCRERAERLVQSMDVRAYTREDKIKHAISTCLAAQLKEPAKPGASMAGLHDTTIVGG